MISHDFHTHTQNLAYMSLIIIPRVDDQNVIIFICPIIFYWTIGDLQYCVCGVQQSDSEYIYSFSDSFPLYATEKCWT